MYREFKIKDEEGKETKFKVYPNLAPPQTNLIKSVSEGIDMTLPTKNRLMELVGVVNKFMSGNSINEVEVKEIEG